MVADEVVIEVAVVDSEAAEAASAVAAEEEVWLLQTHLTFIIIRF